MVYSYKEPVFARGSHLRTISCKKKLGNTFTPLYLTF